MTFLCLCQSTRSPPESGSTEADLSRRDRCVDQKHPNLACLQMTYLTPAVLHLTVAYLYRSAITLEHPFHHAPLIVRDLDLRYTYLQFTLSCPVPLHAAVILSLLLIYIIRYNALELTFVIIPLLPVSLISLHRTI